MPPSLETDIAMLRKTVGLPFTACWYSMNGDSIASPSAIRRPIPTLAVHAASGARSPADPRAE